MIRDSGFGIRDSGRHGSPNTLRFGWLLAVLTSAMMFAGCGGDNTPTAPTKPSGPVTENWSSVVAPGGASTRSFTLSSAGTISVTLTDAGATLGLGVGLPRTTGGGCRLSVAVNASADSSP